MTPEQVRSISDPAMRMHVAAAAMKETVAAYATIRAEAARELVQAHGSVRKAGAIAGLTGTRLHQLASVGAVDDPAAAQADPVDDLVADDEVRVLR